MCLFKKTPPPPKKKKKKKRLTTMLNSTDTVKDRILAVQVFHLHNIV